MLRRIPALVPRKSKERGGSNEDGAMGSGHLVVVMVIVGFAYVALTQRMWAVRHDFAIMVRSPNLICVSTLAGLVVMMLMLLQWRSRAEGGSLSCSTLAWVSPFGESYVLNADTYIDQDRSMHVLDEPC